MKEPTVAENQPALPAIARSDNRHSHIGIRLHVRINDVWVRCEALGWNEVGFNFYDTRNITGPVLELKRGLTRFCGTVVWSAPNASDEGILGSLVNELIFEQAKIRADNSPLHARLLKLIRVPGMVAEKRKILVSLGVDFTKSEIAEMMARRRLEQPLFHYGVKVESEAWCNVVKDALKVSSVVIAMEKWSGTVAGH